MSGASWFKCLLTTKSTKGTICIFVPFVAIHGKRSAADICKRLDLLNMDAQDKQHGRLLHESLTPAMLGCGHADVQGCKPAVSKKILCILCIDVNKKSAYARLCTGFRPPSAGVCLR